MINKNCWVTMMESKAAQMESKKCLQKGAPERFQEQIFQELKELEEQKSKETSEVLGHKHKLGTLEKERDRARILQQRGPKAVLLWQQTVLPSVLARPLWRLTWMKQCPRLPGSLPPWRKERDRWSADLEGEMEKLEVEGSFSVAEGGSMDPERNAGHWSARKVLTKEEGEEVKGAENEGQGMEADEVEQGKRMAA